MFNKLIILQDILAAMPSLAVSYSGGTDSSFLLKTAFDILGEKVVAITANAGIYPQREIETAKDFCSSLGVKQLIISTKPLDIPGFSENSRERCYLCKSDLFKRVKKTASEIGIEQIADGSNKDDLDDFRPGMKAIKEQGIQTPLLDVSLSKEEIRQLSKHLQLPTWDKPAMACLASRFPYGEIINAHNLQLVEEGENYLWNLGFKQMRVRIHGDLARIEVGVSERSRLASVEIMDMIYSKFKEIGFSYVTIDLGGYKLGGVD
ncbi:MAG: ATP-dependent sacrificial sulfur transferase LarE [Syntrophomonadaceae bacterium]|nr:ATP-dependent sacrificial sulfur transferase LarE [Syntrophomonadaceae bacterium]